MTDDRAGPHGNTHNCPYCGGSGHIDDVGPTLRHRPDLMPTARIDAAIDTLERAKRALDEGLPMVACQQIIDAMRLVLTDPRSP